MDEQTILEKLDEIKSSTLLGLKEVFNTEEACLFLGVSKVYVYKLMREKKIPYFKSKGGKLTYFKKKDLEEWMLDTPIRSRKQINKLVEAM